MSSQKDLCCRPSRCCPNICPDPYVEVWNKPCVTSCGDLRAVVYAPPIVMRFPGPILATCPQDSIVGTTLPNAAYGYGGLYGGGSFSGSVGYESVYGSGHGGGYRGVYHGLYRFGGKCGKCYSSYFGSCGSC